MKCGICNNDVWSLDSTVKLCSNCNKLNRSELFSKILTSLLDIYAANTDFDVLKTKCSQLNSIIKNYPLFITPSSVYDPEEYDIDRVALHYFRNYVISEDNNTLQQCYPIKINTTNNTCMYKTIATLCRLDIDDGGKELRIRNVIDMVLHAEIYHEVDPDLHSCLKWGDTWKYFVLEQLREKPFVSFVFL